MIELSDITKSFGVGDTEIQILKDVDLKIEKGDFVAIMGPSGSGKSTLMNIIGFLDKPTSGKFLFKGKDVSSLSDNQLARFRSSEIGFVFQAFNLLPKTSVLQNVKMPLMYGAKHISEKDQVTKAKKIIKSVGLAHRENYLTNQLSGGEKQRVAIARSLINDPDIILADEPTGNLDSKSGKQVMDILSDLNKKGKTVILVTHDKATSDYAKRIVRVMDGKIEK